MIAPAHEATMDRILIYLSIHAHTFWRRHRVDTEKKIFHLWTRSALHLWSIRSPHCHYMALCYPFYTLVSLPTMSAPFVRRWTRTNANLSTALQTRCCHIFIARSQKLQGKKLMVHLKGLTFDLKSHIAQARFRRFRFLRFCAIARPHFFGAFFPGTPYCVVYPSTMCELN
jgi:hypothetical protein